MFAANLAKKQEFYELYVLDTFTNPKVAGEAASLIKIMDLRDNALTIGLIRTRSEQATSESDREFYRGKYESLKKKYRNVLMDLYIALPGWPKDTWVGSVADDIRQQIGVVLKSEYGVTLA